MKEDKWTIEQMYSGSHSVDSMISCIEVLNALYHKYPNDECIEETIEILRDEICHLFGGTINKD